jgi:GNAT superfamily N-acetyltransferase
MKHTLRQAEAANANAISTLVQQSFAQFVAPDWDAEAQRVFMAESSPERLASLIPTAAFGAVAESRGQLVGFILLPTPSLVGFLFVEPTFLRQGIAKGLWESARRHIESEYSAVKTVELNSSPYAVSAYKALGFYPISEPFRRGGCLATRMACWLPGQALANAPNAA